MDFVDAIRAFFDSTAGNLALWVVVIPVVDFVLSVAAAIRDDTFQLDAVAAFLRKHIMGRVVPIWILLFLGYVTEDVSLPVIEFAVLETLGIAAATLYLAETIGSILRSWGPTSEGSPTLLRRAPAQPIPED